ncbi:MAG: hypothetical protein NTX03_02275 [Bacteroidetes bacterium]|nr:hypothetical protein [Bacteroidota bacterium]
MNRKNFLRNASLAGLGLALPLPKISAATSETNKTNSCTLIPTETQGPFPLDLSANTTYYRKDIRESEKGVQLNLKLKIIGDDNCLPMQNLRVNIWHCNKDGLYSGYDNSMNKGQSGLTYLRGYQFTDANGEANFITIFPGHYSGRVTHIHFQVYVSSSYAAVSQLTFDPTAKNKVYTDNSTIYTNGTDSATLSSDNIFSDGYSLQIASLTKNATTGVYDAELEVTIKGTGTTGIGHQEKENAKNFMLGQNYPNPFYAETNILFSVVHPSEVKIELWDIAGNKVAVINRGTLPPGSYISAINMAALGLPNANYVYQIEIKNSYGIYRDCKLMTSAK